MGAALLTGQKFRALCAFPVENACPLPVGRQEGPPAGARFPAWALKLPPSAALTVPSGREPCPGGYGIRPYALSVSLRLPPLPEGRGFFLPTEGVRGFACQRCRVSVGHRAEGSGETCATFSYVSPAILGTFGAQKYRIGAGHADVLPYHSCRRHTARFLPPSQHPPGPSPAPRAVYGLPVPPPLCFFAKAAHVKLTCAATSAIISLKEVIPWN